MQINVLIDKSYCIFVVAYNIIMLDDIRVLNSRVNTHWEGGGGGMGQCGEAYI